MKWYHNIKALSYFCKFHTIRWNGFIIALSVSEHDINMHHWTLRFLTKIKILRLQFFTFVKHSHTQISREVSMIDFNPWGVDTEFSVD